jgi:hypothetical protein
MHCMTVSLAQGGEGLGAMWGEEKTSNYLQRDDLRYLSAHSDQRMQAPLVIVGAIAYKIHLPDKERLTQDIDFACSGPGRLRGAL